MTSECYFFKFGLLVTGKTERHHVVKIFRDLQALGICHFEIISRAEQLSPITSQKRQIKMVNTRKLIPNNDMNKISLPARKYLSESHCHYVLLIDDLEYDRREQLQEIFDRYRSTLYTLLSDDQKKRVSVHFLVYMVEAYFFAHSLAIRQALQITEPLEDFKGDVETIRHPKAELKRLYPLYDEIEHGGKILDKLDVAHVLSNPVTCAALRTLLAWCLKVLQQSPYVDSLVLPNYQLEHGKLNPITAPQLDNLL